jgi:uncharacterized membrane protein YphA (DoxX/SURF4 family)
VAVFLAAALSKLTSVRRTSARLRLFGVTESLARTIAIAVPVAELVIAALLVPDATARAGGLAAALALIVFSAAVARLIAGGEAPDCNCFGPLHSSRVGPGMLARNLVLAALGVAVAIAGPGAALGIAFGAWAGLVGVAGIAVVGFATWRERAQTRRRLGAVSKSAAD